MNFIGHAPSSSKTSLKESKNLDGNQSRYYSSKITPCDIDHIQFFEKQYSTIEANLYTGAKQEAKPDDTGFVVFDGYFCESVVESRAEKTCVRKVKIYFQIKDYAIEIREPFQENSGKQYGKYLGRAKQAIKLVQSNGTSVTLNEQQSTPLALKAGCLLTILKTNVTFKVLSTTEKSREWLQNVSKGKFDFGANLDFPTEEQLQYRETTSKKFVPKDNQEFKLQLEKALGGGNKNNHLKEQIEQGLTTLNFRLADKAGLQYNLRQRISDDHFELINVKITNSGIDHTSKKLKMNKYYLNETRGELFRSPTDPYLQITARNLIPGCSLTINFEEYQIIGCDLATQGAMVALYGITIGDQYVYGKENTATREVLLANKCDPRFAQAMQNDVELTFAMRDLHSDPYVLRQYKADDTLEIYKIVGPNDGVLGGKIVKRNKQLNPATGANFTEYDFGYGTLIKMNGVEQWIQEPSDFTLNYFAKNMDVYPEFNLETVRSILQSMNLPVSGNTPVSFSTIAQAGKLTANQLYLVWSIVKSEFNDKQDPELLKRFIE